ncbi:MAG: hypothetical protein ACI4BH_11605 [Muribaculaceae bacterium]
MEQNFEISEEAIGVIDSICEVGNKLQERDNGKRLMLEIMTDRCSSVNIDYHDIVHFLKDGGKVTAIEVSVSADDEHRMQHLIDRIAQKCADISSSARILFYLFCAKDAMLTIDEMRALTECLSSIAGQSEMQWGFNGNSDSSDIRAIVLFQ